MSQVMLIDVTNNTETQVHHSKVPDGALPTGRYVNGCPEYVVGYPEDVELFFSQEGLKNE